MSTEFIKKIHKTRRVNKYYDMSGLWLTFALVIAVLWYLGLINNLISISTVSALVQGKIIHIIILWYHHKGTGMALIDGKVCYMTTTSKGLVIYEINQVTDYKVSGDYINIKGIIYVRRKGTIRGYPLGFKRKIRIPRIFKEEDKIINCLNKWYLNNNFLVKKIKENNLNENFTGLYRENTSDK